MYACRLKRNKSPGNLNSLTSIYIVVYHTVYKLYMNVFSVYLQIARRFIVILIFTCFISNDTILVS